MTAWIADALIVLGLAVMTLGIYGIVRFPDVYTQLHASSKAAFLGVSALLVAAAMGGEPAIVARAAIREGGRLKRLDAGDGLAWRMRG